MQRIFYDFDKGFYMVMKKNKKVESTDDEGNVLIDRVIFKKTERMKDYIIYLLVIIPLTIMLALPEAAAQTHHIKFNQLSGSNGITLGKINSITRDRHGVMWFSDQTNRGIVRYDGNTMTRYQQDPKNPNSPGGAYPEYLYADLEGNIWIGYYGMGFDVFNYETNSFTHFRHNPEDIESLSNDTVSAVLIDHLGNIWIGTNGGLNLFDKPTGKFTHYKHIENDSSSLSCNEIRALYEDSDGTLWVGTGLPWDLNDEGGLNRFNRETGTFTRFMHDENNPTSLRDNKVRAIYEDKNGTLWIGTRGDGLHTLDKITGKIKHFPYQENNTDVIQRPEVKSAFDHITFITEDAAGYMWIGTLDNGILRYNPGKNESTHFTSATASSSGFHDNSTWQVFSSDDGLFWVSTQENRLYRVDLYTNHFPHQSIDSSLVIDFLEESGYLWFATGNGLVKKQRNSDKMQIFRNNPQDPGSISNDIVLKLLKSQQGTLWIGTQNGLNRYEPYRQTFKKYFHDPHDPTSLSSSDIGSIYEDHEHNLWIGTFGGGLNKFNPKDGKSVRYMPTRGDTNSISSDYVVDILPDDFGKLWLATLSYGGINRLNIRTGEFQHYLPQVNIWDLYEDSEGTLWAGGVEGLFRYNRKLDMFIPLNEPESGFNVTNIGSVAEDKYQNLWMTSENSIYRYNRNTENLLRFGEENNIKPGTLTGTMKKLANQEFLFGTLYGYYSLNPDNINVPVITPKIYYKNIWVNGQLIKPAETSLLTEPLSETQEIQLNHNQNVFSIDLASIYYGNPANINTYYKLENYDDNWRELISQGQVYYFNIPAGTYKFLTKSVNRENGIWVEKSLAVSIDLPWWKSWWAYVAYIIIFISGILIVHSLQRQHVLRVERARTHKRELVQARKIEKAYQELKATQAQLIHSEKMASLGELTAGIAHEIQNPLNFVTNFSEISNELVEEMKEELAKGNLQLANEIAGNVKENLEKINHHGKRADAIVKGMLQHSRTGSGIKVPTDINVLADEYLRLSYHGLRAQNKSFNADYKTDLDAALPKVNIIPQDIGRVLLNLINNAFYAVEQNNLKKEDGYKPLIIVRTGLQNGSIEIKVEDNGPGIPAEIKDKIFQPFFTTKPTGQGTGLGLSLSYDIVKAHGGDLKVTSKNGGGSIFILTLPLE
jgi:signal transduction histidine kinase/ligand-binding sensor domain-containing protein